MTDEKPNAFVELARKIADDPLLGERTNLVDPKQKAVAVYDSALGQLFAGILETSSKLWHDSKPQTWLHSTDFYYELLQEELGAEDLKPHIAKAALEGKGERFNVGGKKFLAFMDAIHPTFEFSKRPYKTTHLGDMMRVNYYLGIQNTAGSFLVGARVEPVLFYKDEQGHAKNIQLGATYNPSGDGKLTGPYLTYESGIKHLGDFVGCDFGSASDLALVVLPLLYFLRGERKRLDEQLETAKGRVDRVGSDLRALEDVL